MGLSDARTAGSQAPPAPIVYVVDDSPDLAEMLEMFLTAAGYPTQVFHEPWKAVETLRTATQRPKLLVTDFQMPGMNGMELIQRCRELHPGLKVISASGHLPEAASLEYPSKPDSVLAKPYTSRQLVDVVKSLIGPQPPAQP
jgi:CheY-like chemotaxis protein